MAGLRIRDRLERRASGDFVGRPDEVRQLMALLDPDGPIVVHLHGIGGIGKTTLVTHFAAAARGRGASVIQLDGRAIEPTERGFLSELGRAIGVDLNSPDAAARRLAELANPVLLAVDTYEVLRLLDTWMRRSFVPSLSEEVRVLLSGREPPVSGWLTAPGWRGLFASIHLDALPEEHALELLSRFGVDDMQARRMNRYTRGHPLALRLAAAAAPDLDLPATFSKTVVEELTRLYLADIGDPLTNRALEAVSVVRRVTHSLLAALVPGAAPADLDARLRDLPFVEAGRDGLIVHDLVREAVSASLRAADPARYRALRHAAWTQLNWELETVGAADLWRYTADMLYLIENPHIREAFFPSDHQPFAVEPALPDHGDTILQITRDRDGQESAQHLGRWWHAAPSTFRVVCDRVGAVAGYICMLDTDSIAPSAMGRDPVLGPVCQHLSDCPLPHGQRALVLRKWLSRQEGEAPSAVQANCWLDCKRFYLEMRDELRRVYVTTSHAEQYLDALTALGFRFTEGEVPIDDRVHRTLVLDMGPGLVGGWMSGIVGAELRSRSVDILDERARELVVGEQRIPLTQREFEVMRYFQEHDHEVAGRSEMLAEIWGTDYEGASNVVDVLVRSLRKKLGGLAGSIETVRGIGYRFHAPDQESLNLPS